MLLALGLTAVLSQPFAPGQGVLPSGTFCFDGIHLILVNDMHAAGTTHLLCRGSLSSEWHRLQVTY